MSKTIRTKITLRDLLRPVVFTDFNGQKHPGMLSNWRKKVATVTYDLVGEHGTIVGYGYTSYLSGKDLNRIEFIN